MLSRLFLLLDAGVCEAGLLILLHAFILHAAVGRALMLFVLEPLESMPVVPFSLAFALPVWLPCIAIEPGVVVVPFASPPIVWEKAGPVKSKPTAIKVAGFVKI